MLQILMVISEAPPVVSGIARIALRLRQGLQAQGHHVDVLSVQDVPRFVRGEFRVSSMLWRAPHVLLPRLTSYDIVHIHGPVPTFSDIALLLSVTRHHPTYPRVVYTHHSEIDLRRVRALSALYSSLHKRVARLADHVAVSTPAYARNLAHYLPPERIAVIPWGVDLDPVAAVVPLPKAARFTALFVGQLRPYKGLDTLLDAAEHLTDIDVHIVGSGHQEGYYRALVAQRGLDHVTFHGNVSDAALRAAYARAHVLVLPSTALAEAFGLVLLEGMAAGCVPIVSRLPGPTDVVGNAGLHFPVGDAAALSGLLVQLRDDAALCELYSRRAQERARCYSWQRTVAEYHALYIRLELLARFEASLRRAGQANGPLEILLHDTVAALDASAGSFMFVDPGTQMLRVCATTGSARAAWLGRGQPLGQGIAGLVAARDVALRLPEGLSAFAGEALTGYARRRHIQSALVVPLSTGERILGVLNVSSDVPGRRFEAPDLQWASGLARHAARLLAQHAPSDALWQLGTDMVELRRRN